MNGDLGQVVGAENGTRAGGAPAVPDVEPTLLTAASAELPGSGDRPKGLRIARGEGTQPPQKPPPRRVATEPEFNRSEITLDRPLAPQFDTFEEGWLRPCQWVGGDSPEKRATELPLFGFLISVTGPLVHEVHAELRFVGTNAPLSGTEGLLFESCDVPAGETCMLFLAPGPNPEVDSYRVYQVQIGRGWRPPSEMIYREVKANR